VCCRAQCIVSAQFKQRHAADAFGAVIGEFILGEEEAAAAAGHKARAALSAVD
jgi:hypothetical protein